MHPIPPQLTQQHQQHPQLILKKMPIGLAELSTNSIVKSKTRKWHSEKSLQPVSCSPHCPTGFFRITEPGFINQHFRGGKSFQRLLMTQPEYSKGIIKFKTAVSPHLTLNKTESKVNVARSLQGLQFVTYWG